MNGVASVANAYRSCEAITRGQAANFFYGIRLLPAERRRAMCAVYAFARRVDDIGDGPLAREEKLSRLHAQECSLVALQPGGSPASAQAHDPVMVALVDARTRFAFPASALGDLGLSPADRHRHIACRRRHSVRVRVRVGAIPA